MSITFRKVTEISTPLSISLGISGASGTGKTFSAFRVARGIAEGLTGDKGAPFAVVDTEAERALHYAEDFPEMLHFNMEAVEGGKAVGFPPDRWIEVIDAAEKAGVTAVVIDSFSHAWEGMGGVLDMHSLTLDKLTRGNDAKRDGMSQLAWAQVKPPYRRLIDRIVRARIAIVICTRAKPVMVDPKTGQAVRKTKTRDARIPWDVASDADLLFEMTAQVMLDPSAPGCPVYPVKRPDQLAAVFDPTRPLSEETGRQLAYWSKRQGDGARVKEVLDAAEFAAREGSEALRAHWSELSKGEQQIVRAKADQLRRIAAEADAARDADPFAVGEDQAPEAEITEEQKAAAMEAARRAAEEAAKEAAA